MFRMRRTIAFRESFASLFVVLSAGALLYPVLASSASMRRDDKSNLKQLGTAITLYATDADDVLPLAIGRTSASWRWNMMVAVPEDIRAHSSPSVVDADRSVWANAARPYYRDTSLLAIPDAPVVDTHRPLRSDATPATVGIAMNGLLHAYRFAEIGTLDKVPLLWESMGPVNYQGFAMTNPSLMCIQSNDPCRFDPSGGPGGVMFNGPTIADLTTDATYSILMADMSLATRPYPGPTDTTSPWASINADGTGASYWQCSAGRSMYPCFFMPNSPEQGWRP